MSWGVYLHLPFCRSRCRYCAFYSGEPLHLLPELVRQLETEVRLRRDTVPDQPVGSVYFGGGTPGLLAPEQVAAVLAAIECYWGLLPEVEVTLEVNPGDVLPWYALRAAGITRLSVGVQALENALLRRLGRRHTAEQARVAVREAAAAGFSGVSADLMVGLSGLTPGMLSEWVTDLARDGANHLSVYGLELHPGTELTEEVATGRFRPASDQLEERQYQAVERTGARQGFDLYEVSNFARPGHQCRHNLNYWTRGAYLGLGPGAHSYLPERGTWGSRFWNDPDLGAYLNALRSGRLPPSGGEGLTREQALLEQLFLDLRRPGAISLPQLAARFVLSPETCVQVFREISVKGFFRMETDGLATPTRAAMRRADGLALAIQERLLQAA